MLFVEDHEVENLGRIQSDEDDKQGETVFPSAFGLVDNTSLLTLRVTLGGKAVLPPSCTDWGRAHYQRIER
jgi:hypothetical protein